jgi:hypothetical protein
MPQWVGEWIWTREEVPERNAFVRFRRQVRYDGGKAVLHITADSRYWLWVNGQFLGHGPVRAWPSHWKYDTYDLAPQLDEGQNVIAVLVQHYGEGNFQYNLGPPGLLAELEMADKTLVTNEQWRASPDPATVSAAPRISVQEGFEEQFDARNAHDWTQLDYEASWPHADPRRESDDGHHADLRPRGIPFLTLEPVLPQRVLGAEAVRSIPHRFTIWARPYVARDLTANQVYVHAYLATQVWAPEETAITFRTPHWAPGPMKVNGEPVEGNQATLQEGWNSLVAQIRRPHHYQQYCVAIDGPPELRFSVSAGEEEDEWDSAWAIVGPFALNEDDRRAAHNHMDESLTAVDTDDPEERRSCEAGERFWASGDLAAALENKAPIRLIDPEDLPEDDVFVQAYTDKVTAAPVKVEGQDGLLSGADWTTIHPPADGSDVRLLLDFGQEVVGMHRFEVAAPEGTILDAHNFEFIQPDGRFNFAEGMNNAFRYICREGTQSYQTLLRRGFQYSYLILRNLTGTVKLRGVQVLFASYPQSRRGRFACSDAQLDRIWSVGAHSLRCCAEDTYTDCPTYEQTHWVGDARNEALIDWAINGDPRLWYRCLEQTGESLERSPITESHVPSAWQNILPAWSFLWMRSCREYLLFTGDRERSQALLDFIRRNVDGIQAHLNDQGLIAIHAWNMFDWAAMDTPTRGVVTHLNCQAVHALKDAADLAQQWRGLATRLSEAINNHLWVEEAGAYTDCLRDGQPSDVLSQQTQTAACAAGVAVGPREERCRAILHDPPEGFVRAGSPFFEFFLLEAYQAEGRDQAFIDTIREDWGFMVDAGATTFWEMWSGRGERLTRSHCHGWSAAPTFFLSTWVLGVRPGGPGFEPCIIEPHPGSLAWCRGRMPTPLGDVETHWENAPDQPFLLHVHAPQDLDVDIRLPREGAATLNGEAVETGH